MDKVCAVVDAQGFDFEDRFVARELAICSEVLTQCQELNPKLNWRNLTEKEQETVLHCTKFKHGLHFCPFNPVEHAFLPHSNDVGVLLKLYYDMISTSEKPLFAFKNRRVGEILKAMSIPTLDLDDVIYKFPPMKELENIYGNKYTCAYHKRPPRDDRNIFYRCAYRKCNQIWRYLKNESEDRMAD